MRVYIPNKGSHDYTAAREYGELVFVTTGNVNPFNTGKITRQWRAALKDSEEGDFIVVTGLNALCMIGAALFGKMHGRVNLLIFTGKTGKGSYKKREVIL